MPDLRLVASVCFGLLVCVSAAHASPCSFKSVDASLPYVSITPAGAEPFMLTLARLPVEVTPGPDGVASLHVEAPLRFTTEHPTNQLGMRLAKRSVLADGRLVLNRGLAIYVPSLTAEQMKSAERAEEQLTIQSPLRALHSEVALSLPCSSLTIPSKDESSASPSLVLPSTPAAHVKTSEFLSLYKDREKVDPLRLKFAGPLLVIAQQKGWVRLQARWSDGSTLQGWVPRSEVTIDRRAPIHMIMGEGRGGLGLCGSGNRPALVKLRLHSHAPIHDAAGGEIWAHTAGTIAVHAFPLRRSDGWIRIGKVDGFPRECSEHDRFWVHATHVLWTAKENE